MLSYVSHFNAGTWIVNSQEHMWRQELKQQQQQKKTKQTHNKPEAPCLWITPFSSDPLGERSP